MKATAIFLFISLAAFGQTQPDLKQIEIELARLGQNSIRLKTEEQRLAAADTFATVLDANIDSEKSFSFAFANVSNLSKLISPDKTFRVYTWSVPLRDGTFIFYGRLVLKSDEGLKVIPLNDGAGELENPENMLLKTSQWYGVIYYDIIITKEKSETVYTLLGYRPSSSTHNEKVVEILSLENPNSIRFGAKVFNTPILNTVKYKRPPFRLIVRYSPKSVASVKYIENEKRIVMDHLAPADVEVKDKWAAYGPDFSYQALYWKDGHWQLDDDITITNDIAPTAPQPTQKGLPKK